jgi:exopolyphosphatase/guanosine-5'-triphosphate,3'-diphosphate pyrophosphatase
MKKRIAAVDIGTNTILMHIAEIDSRKSVASIRDEHRIARLGENLNTTGNIQLPAIERACKILSEYASINELEKVSQVKLIGTSALRDAANREHVINLFKNHIDGEFEIISGEEEAALSFLGTVEDENDSTVIDIGGGSTEFIKGKDYQISDRISLNLGAVRLSEQFIPAHPPSSSVINLIRNSIHTMLADKIANFKSKKVYAVAGTPVTIASVLLGLDEHNAESINGYILNISDIEKVLNIFLSHDLDYLVNKLHIHKHRADVITSGTLILYETLTQMQTEEVIVSTKGLRYGIIKSMITK